MDRKSEGGLTPREEDYLEALLIIEEEGGGKPARLRDVSRLLGVKMPSAVQMLRSLSERGLVNYERYGWIELTPEGRRLAREVYKKHVVLRKFLEEFLGVEGRRAAEEACSMEHYLDEEALARLVRFLEFFEVCSEREPLWLVGFRRFTQSGKLPWFCGRSTEERLADLKTDRLSDLGEGEAALVVVVDGEDLLDRVAPCWAVRVLERRKGRGITLKVGGHIARLSEEEASRVRVLPVGTERMISQGG